MLSLFPVNWNMLSCSLDFTCKAFKRLCFPPLCASFVTVGLVHVSDGLADCMDPDCCLQPSCQNQLYCKGSPDPGEVLSQSPSSVPPQQVRRSSQKLTAQNDDTFRHQITHLFILLFLGCQIFLPAHSLSSWAWIDSHNQWWKSF